MCVTVRSHPSSPVNSHAEIHVKFSTPEHKTLSIICSLVTETQPKRIHTHNFPHTVTRRQNSAEEATAAAAAAAAMFNYLRLRRSAV